MNPLLLLSNISINSVARREELDGVTHLVVPCIAIKEGVLNNIFYSASELENFASSWNGVPVPVNHPMDENGTHITANNTVSESTVNIGRFYNVQWDANLLALKGEIWLNISKAKKLGYIHLIERLEQGEIMEVSTGLFGNTVEEKGTYKDVSYERVISNIRPDHLALLPNDIGACSVKQGCGAMRTNSDSLWKRIKSLFINENSFEQKRELVYQAMKLEMPNAYSYVLEMFSDYFIYELDNKIFRRSYTIDETGKAVLVGENIEVRLERKYVPVSAETITNNKKMKDKKRNAIVNALALTFAVGAEVFANHEDSKLEDAAKKLNLNFDDEGNEVKSNCGCTKQPVVNTIPTVASPLTNEQAQTLARLEAAEAKRLDDKRTKVLTTNKTLTKEIVATFNEDALDALLANTIEQPINYGINGAQPVANNYKAPSVLLGE
jgi:hypothetical protein